MTNILLKKRLIVADIDPNGAIYLDLRRLVLKNNETDIDGCIVLEVHDRWQVAKGDSISLILARQVHSADEDVVRDLQLPRQKSLTEGAGENALVSVDDYDYVMHGQCFKVSDVKKASLGSVFISFDGPLMELKLASKEIMSFEESMPIFLLAKREESPSPPSSLALM